MRASHGYSVQVRENKRVRVSDVSKMPLMTPDPADGPGLFPRVAGLVGCRFQGGLARLRLPRPNPLRLLAPLESESNEI